MGFLRDFTVTVLLVTFLCFFCEALSPEGVFKKYTSLVTGLVISLSLLCAILQIRDIDFSALELPQVAYEAPAVQVQDTAVAAQFASDLAAAVEQSAEKEFSTSVTATANASAKDGVIYVHALTVKRGEIDENALKNHIRTQFGIEAEIL